MPGEYLVLAHRKRRSIWIQNGYGNVACCKARCNTQINADKNIGEWNRFKITFKGDRLSVELNGIKVIENALMPGIPASGPIGLQHHGEKENGEWDRPAKLSSIQKYLY
jgi:hypothetical protein